MSVVRLLASSTARFQLIHVVVVEVGLCCVGSFANLCHGDIYEGEKEAKTTTTMTT